MKDKPCDSTDVTTVPLRTLMERRLLDALKNILSELNGPMMGLWTEGMDNIVQQAEAAIAQAEDRS